MTGPAEAVKKWCSKNGRNSLNPTAERFLYFFISKNLDRKKALRRNPVLLQCFRWPCRIIIGLWLPSLVYQVT